jgi:subfamily B ATP-binding cassette protein MsbA
MTAPNSRWKRLLPYFRPHRSDFSVAAGAMVFDAALSTASVGMLKFLIDQIFIEKDVRMLTDLVWLLPILFFFKGSASFILNYRITKIGHAVGRAIRGELMEKILLLDHRAHAAHKSSDLLARTTNDLAAVTNMVSNVPLYLIRDGLTVAALTTFIFWLNARFALVVLATIPIFAVIFLFFISKLRRITAQTQELVAGLYATVGEAMLGLTTIKAYLYERSWLEKFRSQNDSHYRAMLKFQKITAISPALMEFLSSRPGKSWPR